MEVKIASISRKQYKALMTLGVFTFIGVLAWLIYQEVHVAFLLAMIILLPLIAIFFLSHPLKWFGTIYVFKEDMDFSIVTFPDQDGFAMGRILIEENECVRWDEIVKAGLSPVGSEQLRISLHNGRTLSLPLETMGSKEFILRLPVNLIEDQKLVVIKEEMQASLISCEICGKVALYQDECLFCGCETYEAYSKDINQEESQEAYIRLEQLDFFIPADSEPVDFYPDSFFAQDPSWLPLVAEDEVIAWAKDEA